jgi:hypothetical protein
MTHEMRSLNPAPSPAARRAVTVGFTSRPCARSAGPRRGSRDEVTHAGSAPSRGGLPSRHFAWYHFEHGRRRSPRPAGPPSSTEAMRARRAARSWA